MKTWDLLVPQVELSFFPEWSASATLIARGFLQSLSYSFEGVEFSKTGPRGSWMQLSRLDLFRRLSLLLTKDLGSFVTLFLGSVNKVICKHNLIGLFTKAVLQNRCDQQIK